MTSKIQVDNIEGRTTKGSINITEGSTTSVLQRTLCNTWASTKQTSSTSIYDSINVSSVADGGTGHCDYTFTIAYTALGYSTTTGASNDNNFVGIETGSTTSTFTLVTNQHDGSAEDAVYQNFQICGDLA